MAANDSFFRNQNGGCGYILKPDYLRSVSEVPFDPSKPEDLAVSANDTEWKECEARETELTKGKEKYKRMRKAKKILAASGEKKTYQEEWF